MSLWLCVYTRGDFGSLLVRMSLALCISVCVCVWETVWIIEGIKAHYPHILLMY